MNNVYCQMHVLQKILVIDEKVSLDKKKYIHDVS